MTPFNELRLTPSSGLAGFSRMVLMLHRKTAGHHTVLRRCKSSFVALGILGISSKFLLKLAVDVSRLQSVLKVCITVGMLQQTDVLRARPPCSNPHPSVAARSLSTNGPSILQKFTGSQWHLLSSSRSTP